MFGQQPLGFCENPDKRSNRVVVEMVVNAKFIPQNMHMVSLKGVWGRP
jgi:hypothetical protein